MSGHAINGDDVPGRCADDIRRADRVRSGEQVDRCMPVQDVVDDLGIGFVACSPLDRCRYAHSVTR
jgi:hypothetical protein